MINRRRCTSDRRGVIIVLVAILIVPLLGIVAFAIDYGNLLKIRSDLQRNADLIALAAVQDLVPDETGYQDLAAVRATVRDYISSNLGDSFTVLDSDIEIGRYDPSTIYSQVSLLNSGTLDTVKLTLRRDGASNAKAPLFFANVLGFSDAEISASGTAVLQKGRYLMPGADVLPFAVPKNEWNAMAPGNQWTVYGDGKVEDSSGNSVPGNWGTLDIGKENNSTSDLGDQIVNGLRQTDVEALYDNGRISSDQFIDAQNPTWMQADPGLSSGMKHSVQQIHGQTRIIPLYDQINSGNGNNLEYRVTQWGVVKVIGSKFQGSKNTYVTVQKSHAYEGDLRPHPDLSNTTDLISGAYTSPAMVE